ncbi:DUF3558 family protein [Kutzneria sp. NPDC052558]|uniref:DUF3558 family protein n=1 Tax=Kutzneria sp. NPDC052558 TaxID=3364121 RepID=UPI0037C9E46D
MAGVRVPLLVGLAALALAGCSSTSDANPPPVKLDELDLTHYMSKPCSLFDADQLSDLGMSRAAVGSIQPDLSMCVLSAAGSNVIVHLATNSPFPKADAGRQVAGFPAHEVAGKDTSCAVWVVVADTQRISASSTGGDGCHLAENVATSAIATIKRLSP